MKKILASIFLLSALRLFAQDPVQTINASLQLKHTPVVVSTDSIAVFNGNNILGKISKKYLNQTLFLNGTNLEISGQSGNSIDLSGVFQTVLSSGVTIKTINGETLLGPGNIVLADDQTAAEVPYTNNSNLTVDEALDNLYSTTPRTKEAIEALVGTHPDISGKYDKTGGEITGPVQINDAYPWDTTEPFSIRGHSSASFALYGDYYTGLTWRRPNGDQRMRMSLNPYNGVSESVLFTAGVGTGAILDINTNYVKSHKNLIIPSLEFSSLPSITTGEGYMNVTKSDGKVYRQLVPTGSASTGTGDDQTLTQFEVDATNGLTVAIENGNTKNIPIANLKTAIAPPQDYADIVNPPFIHSTVPVISVGSTMNIDRWEATNTVRAMTLLADGARLNSSYHGYLIVEYDAKIKNLTIENGGSSTSTSIAVKRPNQSGVVVSSDILAKNDGHLYWDPDSSNASDADHILLSGGSGGGSTTSNLHTYIEPTNASTSLDLSVSNFEFLKTTLLNPSLNENRDVIVKTNTATVGQAAIIENTGEGTVTIKTDQGIDIAGSAYDSENKLTAIGSNNSIVLESGDVAKIVKRTATNFRVTSTGTVLKVTNLYANRAASKDTPTSTNMSGWNAWHNPSITQNGEELLITSDMDSNNQSFFNFETQADLTGWNIGQVRVRFLFIPAAPTAAYAMLYNSTEGYLGSPIGSQGTEVINGDTWYIYDKVFNTTSTSPMSMYIKPNDSWIKIRDIEITQE